MTLNKLTDDLILQMLNELTQARIRGYLDIKHDPTLLNYTQLSQYIDTITCETIRSFLKQAGVIE